MWYNARSFSCRSSRCHWCWRVQTSRRLRLDKRQRGASVCWRCWEHADISCSTWSGICTHRRLHCIRCVDWREHWRMLQWWSRLQRAKHRPCQSNSNKNHITIIIYIFLFHPTKLKSKPAKYTVWFFVKQLKRVTNFKTEEHKDIVCGNNFIKKHARNTAVITMRHVQLIWMPYSSRNVNLCWTNTLQSDTTEIIWYYANIQAQTAHN